MEIWCPASDDEFGPEWKQMCEHERAAYNFCFTLVRVPLLYNVSEVFQLQVCPKAPPSPHFSHLLQHAALHILQNLTLIDWFQEIMDPLWGFLQSITFTCLQAVIYWPSSDAHSSETEVSHSFCCLAWSLNAYKWSTHMQIANTTANKMQMQRALQLIRLVGTDLHGGDGCSCAFKHFLLKVCSTI